MSSSRRLCVYVCVCVCVCVRVDGESERSQWWEGNVADWGKVGSEEDGVVQGFC